MEKYSSYKDSGEKWLGEIPGHWKFEKVKHLYTMQTGFTPNTKVPEFYSDSHENVWVNISDLKTKCISDSESHISNLYIKQFKPTIVPKGSLLYSFKLSVGEVAFADTDLYTNEAIASFLPNENIDLGFLFYSAPLFIIKNANENIYGAKILNQQLIKNALIVFPPLPEQQAIVSYLDRVTGDIDRAIAESQRMIDLLNERKQIIIQHAVTKGLNPNAKRKYSGVEWIGDVPEGWDCLPVRRVAEVNPTSKKKLSSDSVVGYAPMECIRNDNMQPLSSTVSRLSTGLTYCETNDIVLAKVTPCFENGNIAIVPKVENNCCFASSEIFVYRCGDKIESRYLLYFFQNKGFIDAGASTMQGTGGLKRVTTEFAKNAFVTLPSLSEQKEIVEYLDDYTMQIKSAIASAERKISLLRERKQIIINEVVTGKVKVR